MAAGNDRRVPEKPKPAIIATLRVGSAELLPYQTLYFVTELKNAGNSPSIVPLDCKFSITVNDNARHGRIQWTEATDDLDNRCPPSGTTLDPGETKRYGGYVDFAANDQHVFAEPGEKEITIEFGPFSVRQSITVAAPAGDDAAVVQYLQITGTQWALAEDGSARFPHDRARTVVMLRRLLGKFPASRYTDLVKVAYAKVQWERFLEGPHAEDFPFRLPPEFKKVQATVEPVCEENGEIAAHACVTLARAEAGLANWDRAKAYFKKAAAKEDAPYFRTQAEEGEAWIRGLIWKMYER